MKSSRKTEIMQNFFDYIARHNDFDYEDFKAQFDLTDTEIDVCSGVCPEEEDYNYDDLVIYVRGGVVQGAKCSNPYICVDVCDYDTIDDEDSNVLRAEKVGNQPGMYTIY